MENFHFSFFIFHDNMNIATVFVDLDVTIFCCFFIHVYIILTLADEMFYKQNDIEPVNYNLYLG